MKRFCAFVLMVMSVNIHAGDVVFPKGCVAITSLARQILFKSESNDSQVLYLIHNQSPHELWLTHPVKNPSASAGWSSQLKVSQWSAITVAEPEFALSCVEVKPGSEQYVDCADVVVACEYSDAKFSSSAKGGYWVAENKTLAALLSAIPGRGIQLPRK